jgi:hypothetical protein
MVGGLNMSLLGEELRNRLQREPWWADVKEHPRLAIAIRRGYLNVYSNGQSIFKVAMRNGDLSAETHYKYLLDEATPEYRSFRNNEFYTDGLNYIKEYEGRKTLGRLISNANVYAGDEKRKVHAIIRNDDNSNVVDLEISFTTQLAEAEAEIEAEGAEIAAEKEAEKVGIDRIDMAALEENSEGRISIVFYEVKTFADSRLRAIENAEVIGQLKDYELAITPKERKDEIVRHYHALCSDLVHLNRPVGKPGKINSLIERAAKDQNALLVDPKPRLIIVGFQDDQWHGRWQEHLKKLCTALGKNDRIIGWGDANSVMIGPAKLSPGGRRCPA